jgi:hypothetical protein
LAVAVACMRSISFWFSLPVFALVYWEIKGIKARNEKSLSDWISSFTKRDLNTFT